MSKRVAGNELNRDNWDVEEEPEDAGRFKRAPEEELKKRVIKKAVRRNVGGNNDLSTKSIFSSFTGFKSTSDLTNVTSTSKGSPFSFLSNLTSGAKPDESNSEQSKSTSLDPEINSNNSGTNETSKNERNEESLKYIEKMKDLNQSFLEWITTNINKNPSCVLSYIFQDYENHLSNMRNEYNDKSKSLSSDLDNSNQSDKIKYSFSVPGTFSLDNFNVHKSKFFSFNSSGSSSFGNSKPFIFYGNTTPATVKYPPKDDKPLEVKFNPPHEEGSVFSKKCKIFIKKDSDFVDRGVAALYLKIVEKQKKIQLIARSNSTLGIVLLNVLLTPSFPLQKMENNNILLVCLPTPDSKPPPTSVLIRLQNEESVDEVMNEIKKLIPNEN